MKGYEMRRKEDERKTCSFNAIQGSNYFKGSILLSLKQTKTNKKFRHILSFLFPKVYHITFVFLVDAIIVLWSLNKTPYK